MVCHVYAADTSYIRISQLGTRMYWCVTGMYPYVLVCTRPYVTRMLLVCIRMYPYITRMLLVCTRMFRMLPVCYSYVLVWSFSQDRYQASFLSDIPVGRGLGHGSRQDVSVCIMQPVRVIVFLAVKRSYAVIIFRITHRFWETLLRSLSHIYLHYLALK